MQNEIEQMAKSVCHLDRTCNECMTSFECKAMIYAKRFYNAGYRKADEVAEKIFAEIEERLRRLADESKILRDKEISLGEKTQLNGEWIGVRLALRDIAELKKKYESEKDDG